MNSSAQQSILVTGGAGYIGSITSHELLNAGFRVVIIDNLYSGHRWAVPTEAVFYEGDAGDPDFIDELLVKHNIDAVIHFAGHIVVPESVIDPLKYYRNNVQTSQNLITSCLKREINHFIFSSSAAVYGLPAALPAVETTPTNPINPYGSSKLITEWMLKDVAHASSLDTTTKDNFNYIALRYFNVAGAKIDGSIGQATPEATHLIKVACETVTGLRESITIFGTDYPTPDGTCIRDYIHVEDLAAAHVSAVKYLFQGGESNIFNCGYGKGFSVREVLNAIREISGVPIKIIEGDRRPGDSQEIIADNSKICSTLDWTPKFNDLRLICDSAIRWEEKFQQR